MFTVVFMVTTFLLGGAVLTSQNLENRIKAPEKKCKPVVTAHKCAKEELKNLPIYKGEIICL